MVGASRAGKTEFSRFLSLMNGTSIFQIKVHKDYTAGRFQYGFLRSFNSIW